MEYKSSDASMTCIPLICLICCNILMNIIIIGLGVLKITLCMYPKHALMYSSNHFNIQPHQYTMPYLLCHVLNPNSKSMLLIASILLLSMYSVQYTVYYFNDFIMFYMY